MPYEQRLRTLCAQTLEHSRLIADVSLIHRCIHGQVDFHLEDIGVISSKNNERSGKLRLEQHSYANHQWSVRSPSCERIESTSGRSGRAAYLNATQVSAELNVANPVFN